jgi:hypothetical protein
MAAGTVPADSSTCDMACKGNASPSYGPLCGGRSRLNIYQSNVRHVILFYWYFD